MPAAAKLNLLVVEDEPAIADTLIYALESEGYAVAHHSTGQSAVDHFHSNPVDFVVLDVGLPDITGFDVCREVRKSSNVPILFLTARESEIDRVVGLEIGGDDYVIKPFSPRELTARVQAILRRTQAAPSNPVQSTTQQGSTGQEPDEHVTGARISLNLARYDATCDQEPLELSRYEFGMLKVFLTHPGRVYTRDQLMELVWDEPDSATDRTVDAHIKTLRKKLHAIDADYDPIRTHRGIGYSWTDS